MTDTTDTVEVHAVPEWRMEGLQADVAKLVKRAEKLGVEAPRLIEDGGEVRYEVQQPAYGGGMFRSWQADEPRGGDSTGPRATGRVAYFHFVRVEGERPHFAGWQLCAVVDRDLEEPDAPNLVHLAGEGETDQAWRQLGDVCDHCGNVPRGRKKLVVVEHDTTGERKVVGLKCLQDFLGCRVSPDSLAWYASTFDALLTGGDEDDDLDAYMAGGGSWEMRLHPLDVLATTAAIVRTRGWVSRKQAQEWHKEATADLAYEWLTKPPRRDRDKYGHVTVEERETPTDDDRAQAALALAWGQEQHGNDYLDNVQAVAAKRTWRRKDVGIGASVFTAWQRAEDKRAEREQRDADEPQPEGPLEEGRRPVQGTVLSRQLRETDFGSTWKLLLRLDTGHKLWVTEPSSICTDRGDTVQLTCRIERSRDDEHFGFGSRPSKATVLATASTESTTDTQEG